jgi:OFA family oxalate/formate antiporter-like MFS transporter
VCTAVGGMYLAGTYKTYGETFIFDQNFLSYLGSIASLFNGLGRILWGMVADSIGPIPTITILALTLSLLILTLPYVLTTLGEMYYAIWMFLILFHLGGNFALYLPITVQLFGKTHAGANYGIIFLSYSIFNVLNITILAKVGVDIHSACRILGIITLLGFFNLILFSRLLKTSRLSCIFCF